MTFTCRIKRSQTAGLLALALALMLNASRAQAALKTENVILIMTDGLRWQEVFSGAEERLMTKEPGGVHNVDALKKDFWRPTPEDRREALMPFFWKEIARRGQLYGNHTNGSIAHVTNGKNFSYPGYSEILTGIADPRIDSNDKKPNPNVSVLEWLNAKPAFKGRVTAFANWDVIPFILNTERSGLPVWTGKEVKTDPKLNPQLALLEKVAADTTPLFAGMIMDGLMHQAALQHLRSGTSRVMYVAFGETDEWAHSARYDYYLHAAHNVDRFVEALWNTAQSMPQYRDKTTFIITTDHGRGINELTWRSHGQSLIDSRFIWMAVLGPDTPALGERKNIGPLGQNQIAATLAALLGENYQQAMPKAGMPVFDVLPAR